jgi:hypothetical protein
MELLAWWTLLIALIVWNDGEWLNIIVLWVCYCRECTGRLRILAALSSIEIA